MGREACGSWAGRKDGSPHDLAAHLGSKPFHGARQDDEARRDACGALVAVGAAVVHGRSPHLVASMAPPQGLCLIAVHYDAGALNWIPAQPASW